MTRPALASMLLTLSIALPAVAGDDREATRGTWKPTSAELGGKSLPEATIKAMTLKLEGDAYTVTIGDNVDRGTVKVDPSKSPRAMDILGVEGPNKGKTILAIYELDGDTLRVCYDLAGKARPSAFKTEAKTPLFLVTYRRAKP